MIENIKFVDPSTDFILQGLEYTAHIMCLVGG